MAHRLQSGQALIVMLAFVATLVGGFLLVFNVGQTVNDKIKLLNAADAAAYSAALWEARSLNYQAYMNRAIVANEVAIAQLVSLRSWSHYVDRTLQNVSLITSWIPPLAAATRALARGWDAVDRGLQQALPRFETGISTWNVEVLARVQSVAHVQADITAADLVAHVVKENEPRAQITEATRLLQVRNAAQWLTRFTTQYQRGGRDLRRFTDLLMQSRDGFSASRSGDLLPAGSVLQVSRRGGTDLLDEYSWRAVDTLSGHVDLPLIGSEIPIGWGAAEQRRRPVAQRGVHGGSLRRNPGGSRLALRSLLPSQGYKGVPEIRDVVQPTRQDDRRLTYSVALALPSDRIATADRIVTPAIAQFDGSSVPLSPAYSGNGIHALGSAELYFQRPAARLDRRIEYPSLFSPYWQSRLVETPRADRTLTAPLRGLVVDPFAVLP
jgi:Putative Flp pilus-assembly TadE/G-like